MNSINNNINGMSVNDLIYLFIDGEANDTEKSILFNELSNNSSLQQEFQDALNIKNTTHIESSNIILPVAVSDSIFNKVGIIKTAPIQVPPVHKISGLISKSSLYSLGSGIIGALLTFFLMNITQHSNTQNNNVKNSESSLKKYAASNFGDTIVKHNIIIENDTIYPNKSERISKENKTNKSAFSNIVFKSEKLNNEDNLVKLNQIIPTKFENVNTLGLNNKKFSNKTEPQKILHIPSNNYKIDADNNNLTFMQSNYLKGFTIMLNSISGLKYYPNRDNIYAQSVEINNLALTIKYKLDDTYSIGVTVGKENYPLFIKSNSGDLFPNSTINYYGLNCDINLYDFDFAGDLSTDLRFLACGTSVGFLGKSGIGFVWSPDSKLGLNFGLESTISVSSFNKNSDITGKLGLYYGISYKF